MAAAEGNYVEKCWWLLKERRSTRGERRSGKDMREKTLFWTVKSDGKDDGHDDKDRM